MATTAATSSSANTLDVQSLVSQLMSIERIPIDKLNTKVASYQTKISSFSTLSGLTSSFKTALQSLNTSLTAYSATPSDTSIFTASATSTAVAGSYSLTVAALAQSQNLVATGRVSSTADIGAETDTTLTFDFGTISGNTFNATTGKYGTTLTGVSTTLGSPNITVASTANLAVGATITGVDIPPGATIISITDATNFVISTNATATGNLDLQAAATFTSNGPVIPPITINSTNNTLEGIRDAINAANIGVTATIVSDGSASPYRLAITSNTSGATNSLKITVAGDADINTLLGYDPAATQNLSQTVVAQDAAFTVNGIAVTSATNTITNAIQGVTLTLRKITATPATLVIARDTSAVSTAVSGMVEAYNALASQLKSRSAYAVGTAAAPALSGDGTVRLMQDQLRDIFNTAATPGTGGTLTFLSQIGITTQADGTLKLDSSKLSTAMTTNFSDVTNLFSSATGFSTRLITWSTSVTTAGGLISSRTDTLNTAITGYNEQISKLELRMKALRKQYTTTYSNLNVMLSNMNSTSIYLTQQMSRL